MSVRTLALAGVLFVAGVVALLASPQAGNALPAGLWNKARAATVAERPSPLRRVGNASLTVSAR